MSAPAKSRESDVISDVFAATPEAIPGEYCDRCGRAVPARYLAQHDDQRLAFCAHHIRKYADKLRAANFTIVPDEIDYAWQKGKQQTAVAPV